MYEVKERKNFRPPRQILIDDVTGNLTECWKFTAKLYDLNIVPHGDITYPPISLCDLLVSHMRIEGMADKKEIYNFLKENFPEKTYVTSEFIGCDHPEAKAILPKLPYPMRTENHYPHPIVFIEKGDKEKKRLENSLFFRDALKYAESIGGCVLFFDEELHTKILRSNDLFICPDKKSKEKIGEILSLNRGIEIKIYDIETFYKELVDYSQ